MKKIRGWINYKSFGLIMAAMLFLMATAGAARAAEAPNAERLMPAAGGALVHAGQKDWQMAGKELKQFEEVWKALQPPVSALADEVNTALAGAKQALDHADSKPDETYAAFSKLTKATDAYISAQKNDGSSSKNGKAAAKALLPILQQSLDAIRQNQLSAARNEYKRFDGQWSKAEAAIRSDNAAAYGDIETKISLARISLQAEPPDKEAAAAGVAALIRTIDDYSNGRTEQTQTAAEPGKHSITDALELLQKAQGDIRNGNFAKAAEQLQSFIRMWPTVEGTVQTRAPDVYTRVENQMTEAAGQLLSTPPKGEAAAAVIASMQQELEPFKGSAAYTAWDAAVILLREGVEALLVLVALLAFLQRSGNASKQKWVWGGAATGLVASGALAIILTFAIASVAAGSMREMLEGITGLVSVVMLLTVGAWLHGKSQVKAWNQYIHRQVGTALAGGNLWSLFLAAGLAILREGAETAIFYVGIASSIEPVQMMTGIAGALAVLLLLGYAMVKGSVRLPIRPFFLTAALLIYYLVFKFLGQSVHALQVAGSMPSHSSAYLPTWSWLGVYPTWETTVPQLAVLLFIAVQLIRAERKKSVRDGIERSGTELA